MLHLKQVHGSASITSPWNKFGVTMRGNMEPRILLFIIKLIGSGIVAFLAILLMSKKRTVAWSFMVSGFLFTYAALVYDLLIELGVLTATKYGLWGIPVSTLICTTLPTLCYITAFIIMLAKK